MNLNFSIKDVRKMLEHSKGCKKRKPTYGQKGEIPFGLWLVGDQGVYLMSNGSPGMPGNKTKLLVSYAKECNPDAMPFDEWWANKRASFGGDDGCEFIDGASLEKMLEGRTKFSIELSAESLSLSAS